MSLAQFVEDLKFSACPTESDYLALWQHNTHDASDEFDMALRGGISADRFAWVFLAGYQAAIRSVFREQTFSSWAAFAVTEDRTGKLAPVDWEEIDFGYAVSGFKTWVAASDHVDDLLIKAGRGGRAKYLRIPADATGVSLAAKPAKFLPELSQGVARFDAVKVPRAQVLSTTNVPAFPALEVLFIYVAFAAWVYRLRPSLRSQVLAVVERARAMNLQSVQRDSAEFSQFNQDIQQLLANADSTDDQWQRDKRLITMYDR